MVELVERGTELAELEAHLIAARGGCGCVVIVTGPPGAGKSSLLRATSTRAAELGFLTTFATGDPLERSLPLELLRQLFLRPLERLSDEVAGRVVDDAARNAELILRRAPAAPQLDDERFRSSFRWLVTNLAEEQPLLMCVDDLQWCDRPSLAALEAVARVAEDLAVVIVTGLRSDGQSDPEVARLLTASTTVSITPAPLTADGVRLVAERHGVRATDSKTLERWTVATGGNPFLVTELIAASRDKNRYSDDLTAPETVMRAVRDRIQRLEANDRDVLAWCGILGDATTEDRLAALTEHSSADLRESLERLRAAGLIADDAVPRVCHPLLREAVLAALPASQRGVRHLAASEVLTADGAPASTVAAQLLVAEPVADPAAVEVLVGCAQEALATADGRAAAEFLKRAIREPPRARQRPRVLSLLSQAEMVTDDPASALAHLEEALALDMPLEDRLVGLLRISALGPNLGLFRERAEVIERQLQAHSWDPESRLTLEATVGILLSVEGSAPPWLDARFPEFAALEGSTDGQRRALALAARFAPEYGRPPAEVGELLRRVIVGQALLDTEGPESFGFWMAISGLPACGFHEEALSVALSALVRARASQSPAGVRAALSQCAFNRAFSGDLVRAEEDAIDQGEHAAGAPEGAYRVWALTLILSAQGRHDELSEYLRPQGEPDEGIYGTRVIYCRAIAALARRDYRAALRHAEDVAARVDANPIHRHPLMLWQEVAVLAAASLSESACAAASLAALDRQAERWPIAWTRGRALHARALLEENNALELLEEAATLFGEASLPLDHARVLFEAGSRHRAAGRKRDALPLVEGAWELARPTGASVLLTQIEAELAVLTARPEKWRSHGFSSLTSSERRVARLAAEGRSNREIAQLLFVTERTVENQLREAYLKLGITSRRDLPSRVVDEVAA